MLNIHLTKLGTQTHIIPSIVLPVFLQLNTIYILLLPVERNCRTHGNFDLVS